MKVKNMRASARYIAEANIEVAPGETVEVDTDLGRRLCEQPDNWQQVKPASKKGDD